ncbi:MarR family transcriptional regulator [Paenibacillus macquariensis subsp. macquariensis]|uniref:DNA-binding transcriptional regulator, MarR family n=2 Tax=Paenibacillus macquariensis TaxID=948756 RepID=A0ABY1KBV3_9BACL|nr:MarR family transcriptional regulator [Paenibacillus macquariensis subsp. macquariensis]SIR57332.1 DNA-binding transcriptional regulator, MarR family [Paenibacillus macquariensis]
MSSNQQDQPTDLQENFTLGMRGLGTRTVVYQQNVAASLGLYNNDYLSVDILHEKGPITAGELSKLTGLATGSVTALIDRLEKNGFVRRENDPNDRRKVIIVPLYENKEEVSNTYHPLHSAMLKLASSYTVEELELITQFLGKASTVLEEQIEHLSTKTRK